MKVINDLFDYNLKIFQNTDFFKFSIDSILLAEFASIKNNDIILDMCTGNVPIPLILSTKNNTVKIDAVEFQTEVYALALESIKYNHLEESIKLYNCDIKEYFPNRKYDKVLCNPPYFKILAKSEKNINEVKRIARHEIALTLEEVVVNAKRLIKSNGTFYICHRIDRLLELIKLLEREKFGIRTVVFVETKKNAYAEFFLLEASNYKKSDLKVKTINISSLKSYKELFKEGKI